MIVDANGRFGCLHRYLAAHDDDGALFICETCGHRAEMLPLHRSTVSGRVLPFPAFVVRGTVQGAVVNAIALSWNGEKKR
jgi:hypothetical protein